MAMELFFGSFTVLTFAAVIIVLLTTQKRVNHTHSDREWRADAMNNKSVSDRKIR